MPPSIQANSSNENGLNAKVTPFRYTASAAFLDTLIAAGVKYLFVNLGTDHPGLVEVFAHASMTKRKDFPRVLTCPNEMVALTVAHSYAQITGECQAVLLHVETGTLAMAGALHNAAKGRAPVLVWAGASPSTIEGEVLGGRTEFIQFQQDVHDQRGIVRGYVKYNNEMRFGANVPQLVMRSLQIAKSSPPGPVYLMGAREVMESDVQPLDLKKIQPAKWKPLGRQALADDDAQTIAEALANAKNPLIITSYAGKDQRNVPLLVKLAEALGCGVLESIGSYVNFPASHWAHLGSTLGGRDLEGHIKASDVILVFETDVPWVPHHNKPLQETLVYHIDCDPLKEQMPMHYLYTDQSFRADGNLALTQILEKVGGVKQIRNKEERIRALKDQHEKRLEGYKAAEKMGDVITVQYLSACVRDRLDDKSSIIINEATTNLKFVNDHLLRDEPGSLYSSPAASLGWSGGAAIAAKLAHPEKTVVTMAGDGSYLFTVPSTVHWMANRYNTPFLTIVLNNRGWRAPKGSTLALYPHGQASIATADDIHCSIDPPPDYAGIAVAASSGTALGIKVETPAEVIPALEKALEAVKGGRQALLDVWLPKF